MDNLKNISKMVKEILTVSPDARSSDDVLYLKVCQKCNSDALKEPFWFVLSNLKEFSLPKFESVRRARQKVQAAYPDLSGCTAVEEQRTVNETAFKSFARSFEV